MLLHDPKTCRIGRKPPRRDPRLLRLEKYLPALPPLPPGRLWSNKGVTDWGMMLNDKCGDCTIAGRGHHELLRTNLAGHPQRPTDEQVLLDYIAVTGLEGAAYNPVTGANDNGCVMEDVLDYYLKSGQIGAYVSFDPHNLYHLRFVIDAFEGAYVGVALPIACQTQEVWDVADISLTGDSAPGSWGGHCVILCDYGPHSFRCVTWGGLKLMTRRWWWAYADPQIGGEAYAVLSREMMNGTAKTPSGFNLEALAADLKAL